jgi:hypothetical protein
LYLVADYYRLITNIHSKWFVWITETNLIYCHFWLRYISPPVYQWPRTLKSTVIRIFTWWINPKSHADSDHCTITWQYFNVLWQTRDTALTMSNLYKYSFKAKVVEDTSKKVSQKVLRESSALQAETNRTVVRFMHLLLSLIQNVCLIAIKHSPH